MKKLNYIYKNMLNEDPDDAIAQDPSQDPNAPNAAPPAPERWYQVHQGRQVLSNPSEEHPWQGWDSWDGNGQPPTNWPHLPIPGGGAIPLPPTPPSDWPAGESWPPPPGHAYYHLMDFFGKQLEGKKFKDWDEFIRWMESEQTNQAWNLFLRQIYSISPADAAMMYLLRFVWQHKGSLLWGIAEFEGISLLLGGSVGFFPILIIIEIGHLAIRCAQHPEQCNPGYWQRLRGGSIVNPSNTNPQNPGFGWGTGSPWNPPPPPPTNTGYIDPRYNGNPNDHRYPWGTNWPPPPGFYWDGDASSNDPSDPNWHPTGTGRWRFNLPPNMYYGPGGEILVSPGHSRHEYSWDPNNRQWYPTNYPRT